MATASFNKISFASENFSGVHPSFINAITKSNQGSAASYGKDEFTSSARTVIRDIFRKDCEVYFAFNGTGANNFALASNVKSFNSVLCSNVSHLYVDESTAPEAFLNCRLYPVYSIDGKIDINSLEEKLNRVGDVHHPQPAILSISQPTEYGTVYSRQDIKALHELVKAHNMLLHVDGARFFNAAVFLDCPLHDMVEDIDILTLGGTKNGMLFGEAVLFFKSTNVNDNIFHLKRSMQLASKMRFISCQFEALLQDNLWYRLASHANKMAVNFANKLKAFSHIKITRPVETNAVFVKMPLDVYRNLQEHFTFYLWCKKTHEIRFMFSFDTTISEIDSLISKINQY